MNGRKAAPCSVPGVGPQICAVVTVVLYPTHRERTDETTVNSLTVNVRRVQQGRNYFSRALLPGRRGMQVHSYVYRLFGSYGRFTITRDDLLRYDSLPVLPTMNHGVTPVIQVIWKCSPSRARTTAIAQIANVFVLSDTWCPCRPCVVVPCQRGQCAMAARAATRHHRSDLKNTPTCVNCANVCRFEYISANLV